MTGRRRRKWWWLGVLLGVGVGITLGSLIFDGDDSICEPTFIPPPPPPPAETDSSRSLLFVGVMTARQYLNTRATAVRDTWAKDIPGKVEFFSSEDSPPTPGLPLVSLPGVDDSYPPQKKSFLMLHHIWTHYRDKFEWFLRADDDVYIRPEKLESLLRSVDSRKPLFIGQAGRGNREEFGRLRLEADENFCMGGPGVIMSRETLLRIGPHLMTCLSHLYTNHEDVELGRCVRRFAGVPCTWSYEMQTILYHNSSGNAAFSGSLKRKEIHRAITLHPVKDYRNLYRIHNYIKMLRIREAKQEQLHLYRDVFSMHNILGGSSGLSSTEFEDASLFGQPPGLNKFQPQNDSELIHWDFIQRSFYTPTDSNPKKRIDGPLKEGLEDVVREVMDMINMYSKERGRVIDFKEILYGYHRHDALFGSDYVLDLLLVYKKYRGRKMTVPVRRHAYLQQQYTDISFREIINGEEVVFGAERGGGVNSLKEAFGSGLLKISQSLPSLLFPPTQYEGKQMREKVINFIVPLSGRFQTFKRFVQVFEEVCLRNDEKVSLTVVLFPSDKENTIQRVLDTMKGLQKQYTYAKITTIPVFNEFGRGQALTIGAESVSAPHDLLFFADVDIIFKAEALQRIRANTVRGKSVYFPIVFSEYDPLQVYNRSEAPEHFVINEEAGFWRKYGFGICSLYKSDLLKVGGFNASITGWGKEDVDLFERFVSSSGDQRISVHRSVDPAIVHVFHPVSCDPNLEPSQAFMCRSSRAEIMASVDKLSNVWFSKRKGVK